jgi:hypothetical protein
MSPSVIKNYLALFAYGLFLGKRKHLNDEFYLKNIRTLNTSEKLF